MVQRDAWLMTPDDRDDLTDVQVTFLACA